MLLPVDSQESFVPMGTRGYRIAIGAGSSPHNLRGSSVLKDDVKRYRQAWKDAGHPGDPTTVVRIPTLVADTAAEATRQTEALIQLARRYDAGRVGIGSTDAGSASPEATEEVNLCGTPDDVVDRIHMLREDLSTDEIMFEVNWTSSVPRDVVMQTMRLLTDKVIPQFKERRAPVTLCSVRAGTCADTVTASRPRFVASDGAHEHDRAARCRPALDPWRRWGSWRQRRHPKLGMREVGQKTPALPMGLVKGELA
jgi:hypothetical protein